MGTREELRDRIQSVLGVGYVDQINAALGIPEKEEEGTAEVDLTAQLEKAATVEECWAVYDTAPSGSAVEQQALEKVSALLTAQLEKAATVEECMAVYNAAPDGSAVKQQALDKVSALLTTQLEKATTVEECWAVYDTAPSGSAVEQQALEKALGIATTVKECREVFRHSTKHSPLAYAAIRRIGELLLPEPTTPQ